MNPSTVTLYEKLRLGIDFLDAACSHDGLWRDFSTLAGPSSEWVTAYVLFALAQTHYFSPAHLKSLKVLSAQQRRNGGWSYNQKVPTDCDSTGWSHLALSSTITWRPSALGRAAAYLRRHQEGTTGGFMTYNDQDAIHEYVELDDRRLVHGWASPHTSVTAIAMHCLMLQGESKDRVRVEASSAYLLREKDESGLWWCYWWKAYAYPTYHALRSLAMTQTDRSQVMNAACKTIATLQDSEGGWSGESDGSSTAFATAYNILSLLLHPSSASLTIAHRAVNWLLERQEGDGGWSSVPILRIPPPMVRNPDHVEQWDIDKHGTGVIISDRRRIFTTATVLWALSIYMGTVC